ncbi:MAG: aspartate 1-decarboxylase [Phycisphaerales bacterium]|nr:MAG: aspartate 1-decarboxylase [Phycisphaerales bacterium]
MFLKLLKSKLHRAVVTETKLHYPGSIAIDSEFLEAAGILPYESVLVANLNNGKRFETYVVAAEAGSRRIAILGAAAQLAQPKERVIILAFGFCTPEEAKKLKPKVVVFDENNSIVSVDRES